MPDKVNPGSCSIEYLNVASLFAGESTHWFTIKTSIQLKPNYLFYPLNETEIAIFGDLYQNPLDRSHKLNTKQKQDRAHLLDTSNMKITTIPWDDRTSPLLKFKYGNYGLEKNFPMNYTIAVKQPDIFSIDSADLES